MDMQLRSPIARLQHENERLKRENDELRQEVKAMHEAFKAARALQEAAMQIDANTDVLALMDQILEAAINSIGASDGSLMLVDEDTDELAFVVVHGKARDALTGHRISIGTGIAGWVARHAESVIVPNVNLDPRFSHTVDKNFQFRTHSLLCVPILRYGRVLGVIQAINKKNGKEFTDADLTLLIVVATIAGSAIARAESVLAEEE